MNDSPWEYSEGARSRLAADFREAWASPETPSEAIPGPRLAQRSPVAADVLDSLRRIGTATVYDLAADTGRRPVRVWDSLQRLHRRGLVRRLAGGKRFFGRSGTAPQRWVVR